MRFGEIKLYYLLMHIDKGWLTSCGWMPSLEEFASGNFLLNSVCAFLINSWLGETNRIDTVYFGEIGLHRQTRDSQLVEVAMRLFPLILRNGDMYPPKNGFA